VSANEVARSSWINRAISSSRSKMCSASVIS
jgi:hypothetical protein